MYKLKDVARRGVALAGAAGLLAGIGSSAVPVFVSADALNPLTHRSLSLSSSSPGWSFDDGSGNPTYAYPGSGANGQKTSNFYSFNVSSGHLINAMTFQYCINPAGDCVDPGDDSLHTHGLSDDTDSTSDLRVVAASPSEISGTDWTTISSRTEANAPSGAHAHSPKLDNTEGNFVVVANGVYSPGWIMTASNQEEGTSPAQTGNINMITLTNTMGQTFTPDEHIEVNFFATTTNYITNPGVGAFFVKINDYDATPATGSGDTDASGSIDGSETPFTYDSADINPITAGVAPSGTIIDGGVTVANVMNESIEIQTKVLETMQFSVGTVDPDTLTPAELTTAGRPSAHGSCDDILPGLAPGDAHNVLFLGDVNDEHALSASNTYGTHSYWRLSSNSSAGASVYYAGTTLHDTEGDDINPIGSTASVPLIGTEQFGLALDNDATAGHFFVNHDNDENTTTGPTGQSFEYGVDNGTGATNDGALDPSTTPGTPSTSTGWDHAVSVLGAHDPQLFPLVPANGTSVGTTDYSLGGFQSGTSGTPNTNTSIFNPAINPASPDPAYNPNIKFAFDPDANTHPALLATENSQVVDCVTGKMRYIANIAAITPAGIYTTKINYIAAPQY